MSHDPAKTSGSVAVVDDDGSANQKPNLKTRAIDETKKFLIMTLYLWLLFAVLSLHKTIVLEQHHINYQEQGFAIVNALVLAKVMLVADDLKLGGRFKDRPLIYSVLWYSFAFAVILVCFHIVERAAVALLHGKPLTNSLAEFGAGNVKGVLSVGAIAFIALIPFFLFREIARVIGAGALWQLVFMRGQKTFSLLARE